jgi:phospholipid/cholesterol/gamma-HCH transport system substrate-binding protein
MDSKVNYAIVGIFVITVSIALVASVLWLSVGIEKKNYQTYQVYIQESVSGLNRKASVKYRGVEVGYVRDVALVPYRPHEVRVLLDIEEGVQLKEDTSVVLSVQGLTGLAHLELTGGSIDAPLLTRKNRQLFPEIKTKPSLLVRLDTAVFDLLENINNVSVTANGFLSYLSPEMSNQLLANISALANAMNIFLSDNNQTAMTNILQNFEKVSHSLAAQTDNFDAGMSNLVESTENLSKMSEKVTSLLSQIEKNLVAVEDTSNAFTQIAGAIENTSNAFTKTADSISDVAGSVEETTNAFTQTANSITRTADSVYDIVGSFEETSNAVTQTANSVTRTADSVNNIVGSFEETSNAFTQTANSVTRTADSVNNIVGSFEETSNAFTKTADSITDVVNNVDKTTAVIAQTAEHITIAVKDSRQDMDYFTRQALPEVTNSLRELRILLNNLRSFTQDLERKPNMLLFGKSKVPSGPGEGE